MVTVRRVQCLVEIPFAAIPLAFGVQQVAEGLLWLLLPMQLHTAKLVANVYLLFSHVLWPIYVPFAVLMIEPNAARRRLIAITLAAGAIAAGFYAFTIFTVSPSARIAAGHISYHLPHRHDELILTLYIIGTCVASLLSSHKTVRLFGSVMIMALIATLLTYFYWFISVWCFFAAILSSIIFLHFSQRRSRGNTPAIVQAY